MGALLVVIVAYCAIWGGLCGWLASQKGRDPLAWFLLGCFFSLVAVIVVGLAPSTEEPESAYRTGYLPRSSYGVAASHIASPAGSPPRAADTKRCPMCAEDVKTGARICRFCRHEFPEPPEQPSSTPSETVSGRVASVSLGRWFVASSSKSFVPAGARVALRASGASIAFDLGNATPYSVRPGSATFTSDPHGLSLYDGPSETLRLRPLDGQDPAATSRTIAEITAGPE